MRAVILLLSCSVVAACSPKAPTLARSPCDARPNQVLTVPNAPYGPDRVHEALDLYLPWHKAGEPLILFVHGGGWISGDKRDYRHIGLFFARCGIAFAAINYRLAPHVHADEQASAVLSALRWLADHAALYGFAGDRIFLMGHSAGAELVALATLNRPLRGTGAPSPAGVIAIAGLGYRPPAAGAAAALAPYIVSYYHAAFGSDMGHWQTFDVTRWLRGREPAFLIVHGRDDIYVPEADSRGLTRALAKAGDSVAYLQPAGRDHASVLSSIARDPNDPTGLAIEHFVFSGSVRPWHPAGGITPA